MTKKSDGLWKLVLYMPKSNTPASRIGLGDSEKLKLGHENLITTKNSHH